MRRLTILLVGAMLAVAGCGGDDEAPSSGSSAATSTPTPHRGRLERAARTSRSRPTPSELKFDKTELTAKAGKVTITMDNPSDIPHDVEIEGPDVEAGETVGKGEKSIATADLKAGEYDFYCAVGNHRAAGMEGKLTVE